MYMCIQVCVYTYIYIYIYSLLSCSLRPWARRTEALLMRVVKGRLAR